MSIDGRRYGPGRENGGTAGQVQPSGLHPNWKRLIGLCKERRHLELKLQIADGIPVSAEQALEKIRFDR